jgi:hypothetical protein
MQKALIGGLVALMLGPATILLSLTAILNPAAEASCLPLTSINFFGKNDNPTQAPVGESSRVVFPLPTGTWVKTSDYGMRLHPITGIYKLHSGVDFAAPSGTPIFAAADGRVASAGPSAGNGNLILIEHTVAGQTVATGYAHMTEASIMVRAGDRVTAGQQIASVGSTGYATGPHLHFELRPGGANAATADPVPWLNAQGAVDLATGTPSATGECGPDGDATTYNGDNPAGMVDDPTTTGKITQRTAHILSQVRQQFPHSAWSCFSPRPGQPSEHSLGRACDGTFGNSIGVAARGPALDLGWKATNWMKANAETLGVQYLIWQGKIWSVARSAEGWRPYNGGGMHDPASITGGHYDHLHFTAIPN